MLLLLLLLVLLLLLSLLIWILFRPNGKQGRAELLEHGKYILLSSLGKIGFHAHSVENLFLPHTGKTDLITTILFKFGY